MSGRPQPIGVILAGGLGRRIGGSKALVKLRGRPLITYPLEAMKGALSEVVILVKADTELPSLPGETVWIEPADLRHPLLGIVQAIGLAGGLPVLVCAVDLPFVTSELIGRIASADALGAPAVLAACAGAVQPLLGCYQPSAIEPLSRALVERGVPVKEAIGGIQPRLLEVDDPDTLFNVNAPDDLLQASAMLDRRRVSRT